MGTAKFNVIMKSQFRFSPIQSKEELFEAITHTHFACYELCIQYLGLALPVAGNIGIFCHFEDEYEYLTGIRKELTDETKSWNNKYYLLHHPVSIPARGAVPETTYKYLYIRKPEERQKHVGDVDFYLPPDEYQALKKKVEEGKFPKGVSLLQRPNLDLVRMVDEGNDASAFVGSYDLARIVGVK